MIRTRTELLQVQEETLAIIFPVGQDEAGHGDHSRLLRRRYRCPYDAVQSQNWELENERLKDDIAHMHHAMAEWQRQLGGEMSDVARKQSDVAHQAARTLQHQGR